MTPRATLRLQLHEGFGFSDAAAILTHAAALGVSHLYLSPITAARPGSLHGYDVIDHGRVAPELGGADGLRALARQARDHGMGLLADIVPNHMAADARNPWWRDVLARGRYSVHAEAFDIDWDAGQGRLLLPLLPRPYGEALRAGDIRLAHQEARPVVLAGGQALPLRDPDGLEPADFDPGDPAGRTRLHALLETQVYRLAWWRAAAQQLNRRRFFEISDLVGVRVEDPAVFQRVHALVLGLYADGVLDGLRVDHVDGLASPGAYLRRLRAAMQEAAPGRRPYLLVEKILGPDECLDPRWPIEGTTGYDFMDLAGGLLHDPRARDPLAIRWRYLSGCRAEADEALRAIREGILRRNLAAERRALLAAWDPVRARDPLARDWAPEALARVVDAWLSAFPVYRSYAEDGGPSDTDRRMWQHAAKAARPRLDAHDQALLDWWLEQLPLAHRDAPGALRRLQQLSPPLAAKSLEDTFFYRHGPLLSRNEVGSSPECFAWNVQAFHARSRRQAAQYPLSMLSTATHDHKRGEDARARLAVLSEMPERWGQFADRWLATLPANECTPADRYLLLQTLIGAWPGHWPADPEALPAQALRDWLERIAQWQGKALREAKLQSSWVEPDPAYEAAARACVDALAPDSSDPRPLHMLAAMAAALVPAGWINGLAQALLRNTAPGVPDLYQGCEGWDESLVDPDNRRPVDWTALAELRATPAPRRPDAEAWRSGRVKQYLIETCLGLRRDQAALFAPDYEAVPLRGRHAGRGVAFLRGNGARRLLVVAPRLCALSLAPYATGHAHIARAWWDDTAVALPGGAGGGWTHCLSRQAGQASGKGLIPLQELMRDWPVGLCIVGD